MKEDTEKGGWCNFYSTFLVLVSFPISGWWLRFSSQMFVSFRWRPGKARGVRRPLHGNCRTKDMEVGGGRPILATTSIRFSIRYCLEIIFARLFGPRVLTRIALCLFLRTKQQIMQMQILICNPTNHVTQSLITRNVCRRFERIVLTIR